MIQTNYETLMQKHLEYGTLQIDANNISLSCGMDTSLTGKYSVSKLSEEV